MDFWRTSITRHHSRGLHLLKSMFGTPVSCGRQKIRAGVLKHLKNYVLLIEINSAFKNVRNNDSQKKPLVTNHLTTLRILTGKSTLKLNSSTYVKYEYGYLSLGKSNYLFLSGSKTGTNFPKK